MSDQIDKIKYRAVIEFLSLEGTGPKEIHDRLRNVYGDMSPSYATVKRWAVETKCGRRSLGDEPRSGRPATAVTEENVAALETMIKEDRRITVQEMAHALGISVGSVETILHDHLNMNKVCARWVPRMLTEQMKANRLEKSRENLGLMEASMENFEKRIVTGDETWVYHYDPECKQQSKEWKHPSSPTPKKFKASKSAGKVMCTVFWDCRGPLLVDFLEGKRTITGQYYVTLIDKLREEIKSKRRGKLRATPLLLHDNAPAHTSHVAKAAVAKNGFVELPHPPYSPDLAPSDFFLFPKMKAELKGQRFSNDDEVKEAVITYLEQQEESFYLEGIRMLTTRYQKCIAIEGDYVEK